MRVQLQGLTRASRRVWLCAVFFVSGAILGACTVVHVQTDSPNPDVIGVLDQSAKQREGEATNDEPKDSAEQARKR